MKKSEIAREFADAHKYDFDADYASLAGGEYGEVHEIDNGSGDEFEIEIPAKDQMAHEWVSDHMITVSEGARNPNWQNTLIDTESGEGYTFDNGILKRTDAGADGGNDTAKDRYKL